MGLNLRSQIFGISLFCLVHVYGDMACHHCKGAINFLRSCNVKFAFHNVKDPEELTRLSLLMEEEGKELKKIPQIFICDEHIGGRSDMMEMQETGELQQKFLSHKVKNSCENSIKRSFQKIKWAK